MNELFLVDIDVGAGGDGNSGYPRLVQVHVKGGHSSRQVDYRVLRHLFKDDIIFLLLLVKNVFFIQWNNNNALLYYLLCAAVDSELHVEVAWAQVGYDQPVVPVPSQV